MGQTFVKNGSRESCQLLDELQVFALFTLDDIRELHKRFRMQIHGFALVKAQFESIFSCKSEMLSEIGTDLMFEILDNDHDGRIDGLELLGGLTLCCRGTLEEKARFCFELYDFNLNATLSRKEMVMMMMTSICGMNMLTGGGVEMEPDVEYFETMSTDAFNRADRDGSGQISFEEFVAWTRSNRDLMAGLESLSKIATEAIIDLHAEDSAEEADEGDLSDVEAPNERGAHYQPLGDNAANPSGAAMTTELDATVMHWRSQISEPLNYFPSRADKEGPLTNLELKWAYGYKSKYCRSNLFYCGAETSPNASLIVYPTAALGVVYDSEKRQQTFYQGHKHEVTCMNIHPNTQIVVTGDIVSNIHVWNVDTKECLCQIKGLSKQGVQHISFSPTGDRIATVGLDPDHTVAVYDVSSGEIVSSGKGIASPNCVHDMAYSASGTELVIVGTKQIKFFAGMNTTARSLKSSFGKIGKQGKRQTFFSCAYFGDDCIVGCASGEIYKLRKGFCVQVVQAHGLGEPVLCIKYDNRNGVVVTGGKDSLIKTWDTSLKEVGTTIDMSEDLDGDGKADSGSLDSAVVSVQLLQDCILVGTRGGDILEVKMPVTTADTHTITRIAWSHCDKGIKCLIGHPTRDEFATCGDDKTFRLWSIRSHEQINIRALPFVGTALAYTANGDILALGLEDGSVALMDAAANSFRVYSKWKHCSAAINDIKFSPDSCFLTVACADHNIYMYKGDDAMNFKRYAICRGHSSPVTHIDISASSTFVQSTSSNGELMFWDLQGRMIKDVASIRDILWSTYTCVFGWHVQGIWSQSISSNKAVQACAAIPDVKDIVVGHEDGTVRLYRYPSVFPEAIHQSYIGHSSRVKSVTYSYNRRYVISIGGDDGTILLWKHEVEQVDDNSDCDEGEQEPAAPEAYSEDLSSNVPLLDEAFAKEGSVKRWRSSVVDPTNAVSSVGATDVDLELQWIHGYKSRNSFNNVRYSSAGSVVYTAAAVGVVFSKNSWKQKFLQGAHSSEIMSIAAHPSGQLFATGDSCRKATIVVWNSQEMTIVSRIEKIHENGVNLLAFSNKGNILASGGLDNNNSIFFLDWSKGVPVMKTSTSKSKINCMCFLADSDDVTTITAPIADILVTAGDRHIKFWWSLGQNVKSQRGLWGDNRIPGSMHICSVASATPGVCVTGSADGNIIIWKKFRHNWDLNTHPSSFVVGTAVHNDFTEVRISTEEKLNTDVGPIVLLTTEKRYPHHKNAIQALWGICGKIQTESSLLSFITENCASDDFEKKFSEKISKSCRYITGDKDGNICIWMMLINDTRTDSVEEKTQATLPFTQENLASSLKSKLDATKTDESHNKIASVASVTNASLTKVENLKLHLIKHFKAENVKPKPTSTNIRSLCERDGSILIGTLSSDIFEVLEDDMPFHRSIIVNTLIEVMIKELNLSDLTGPLKSQAREIITTNLITDYTKKCSETQPLLLSKLKKDLKVMVKDIIQKLSKSGDGDVKTTPIPFKELKKINDDVIDAYFLTNSGKDDDSKDGVSISSHKLLSGHYRGELWGLVCHPLLPVYFTAGDDGTLRCWSLMEHKMISYCAKISEVKQKIRAIDIDPNGDDIAVSLSDGKVYILKIDKFINPKGKKKTFIDSSLSAYKVEFSVTITPNNVNPNADNDRFALTFPQIPGKKHKWSSVLKYSLDTNIKIDAVDTSDETKSASAQTLILLAVASSDKMIYIFNKSNKYDCIAHAYIKGDSTKIERCWNYTHIDFGVILNPDSKFDDKKFQIIQKKVTAVANIADKKLETVVEKIPPRAMVISDLCMQCATDAGDLIYYKFTSIQSISHEDKSSIFKDAYWFTWTSPYGWPVQGVWENSASGEIDINSVSRSKSWSKVPVVAVGSDSGAVQLFNYPCANTGAPDKCYKGHSGFVTNVSFSFDDSFVVSTGGLDNCIFVWGSDVLDELKQKESLSVVSTMSSALSKSAAAPLPLNVANKTSDQIDDSNEIALPIKLVPVGDQFTAVKPWKGAIREPSDWKDPENLGTLPDASLELKFVYGYRGWDCRNNIGFGDSSFEVIYHIAAVGVVYNSKENTQVINTEHDDDIICLSVHPAGHTVATGEIGKEPKIVIWDANTGITVKVIKFHKKGVSNISWSASGTLLISIGMDDDRTVCVNNAKTGNIVGLGKVGRGIDVYSLTVMGDSNFITGGKNHVKFWDLPSPTSAGGEISSKGGSYHKSVDDKNVICSSFLGTDFVTGMKNGKILLWKEKTNTKVVDAHEGPCTSMCCLVDANTGKGDSSQGPRIISGGNDGFVYIWNLQFVKIWSFDLSKSQPASVSPQIHSLSTREGRVLVGTKGGEIYEVNILNSNELYRWQQSHYGDRAEAWGLAVHPNSHKFATSGDDGTIRLWDAKTKQQIKSISVKSKTRAVCYSPDGFQIAAASFDGRLRVFSADLQSSLADVAVAKEWSQAICFSPNGLTLAVGSHDNVVYLLDTKTFSCRAKCISHHSYITGIDFSDDSTVMRTTSGDYELLFWDARSGKQITSASAVRDVKWATTTCTLGWAVQGIWPARSDGTDVNAVDKSNITSGTSAKQQLLVSGDDFRKVKIFRYPCIKEKSSFKVYKGHSENVMNVKFSHDSKYVYSIGGLDKAILQFEVMLQLK